MAGATEYEISLGSGAPAGASASRLIAELHRQGVEAVAAPDGVIVVKAVSVPSLTAAATLLREAERGLVLDTSGAGATLTLGDDLPPGSLRILRPGTEPETRQGMSPQQVGYLLRTALAAMDADPTPR